MKSDCPRIDDLLQAHGLGPDHPRRTHVDECARCRALLAAQDHFLAEPRAADPDEAARLADADKRLAAFVDSLHTVGNHRRRSLTWALGLAAIIVVAVGFRWLAPHQEVARHDGTLPAAEQVWRGGGSDPMSAPAPTAETQADGALRLGWAAVAGAERYEVVLLTRDLTELSRWDAGDTTTLTLPVAALPADLRGGFFAVAAFAADRELGHWAPVLLP